MNIGFIFKLLFALPELTKLLRAFSKYKDNYEGEQERKAKLNDSIKNLRVAFEKNDPELLNDTFNNQLFAKPEKKIHVKWIMIEGPKNSLACLEENEFIKLYTELNECLANDL